MVESQLQNIHGNLRLSVFRVDTFVCAVFQGKPKEHLQTFARFTLNIETEVGEG